jgi:putative ABC transport system permease protein
MWLNTLWLALRSIRRNLLRSFLTILGIVIGVSAVITMVTLGNGATLAVQNQISSLGTNLLQVRPGQRMGPGGGGRRPSRTWTPTPSRSRSAASWPWRPRRAPSATVVAGGRNWSTSVIGSTNAWLQTGNWSWPGRAFSPRNCAPAPPCA